MTAPLLGNTDLQQVIQSMDSVFSDLNGNGARPYLEMNKSSQSLSEQIRDCFLCDICSEVLICPYTCSLCLHSYCKNCIFKELDLGEDVDVICPVEGCGFESLDGFRPTLLGPDPFNPITGKIKPDLTLLQLTQKLFRMEDVSGQAELISMSENMESSQCCSTVESENCVPFIDIDKSTFITDHGVLRTIAPRVHRSQKSKKRGRSSIDLSSKDPVVEYTTVGVFRIGDDPDLDMFGFNYFRFPSALSISNFSLYLNRRFALKIESFYCRGIRIEDRSLSLGEILDEFWIPFIDPNDDVFTLKYTSPSL
eukprot:g5818.t1